ncbi:MAG TPA: hypothetical protein V6C71_20085 [Coleofasciculaceae cyanobacterium]
MAENENTSLSAYPEFRLIIDNSVEIQRVDDLMYDVQQQDLH